MSAPAWRTDKTTAERGYDARWQAASASYLLHHPLCRMCEEIGRTTEATLVDHVEPHRGDAAKFWDEENWQPLCVPCHNGPKQRQEKSGIVVGCTPDGLPLDPNHHWNKTDVPPSEADRTEDRDRHPR